MNAIANFREQKKKQRMRSAVWYMTKGGTFFRLQLFYAYLPCTR